MFKVGDKIEATDGFGNYSREKGIVVGFTTNLFGIGLVEVELHSVQEYMPGRTSVFYPSELKLDNDT